MVRPRKVLLHAAKNGFFYVIDRENGKLISADKLGTVTWADHVDLESGRPVLAAGAKYENKNILLWPSFQAVHHWTPQSFSPLTGYVYEPTLEMPAEFGDAGVDIKHFNPQRNTPESTGLAWAAAMSRPTQATACSRPADAAPDESCGKWRVRLSNGGRWPPLETSSLRGSRRRVPARLLGQGR